jgi:hypothetical protein
VHASGIEEHLVDGSAGAHLQPGKTVRHAVLQALRDRLAPETAVHLGA